MPKNRINLAILSGSKETDQIWESRDPNLNLQQGYFLEGYENRWITTIEKETEIIKGYRISKPIEKSLKGWRYVYIVRAGL